MNVCEAPLSNKTFTLFARPRAVLAQAYARGKRPCKDSLVTLAPVNLLTRPDLGPKIGAFSLNAPPQMNNDPGR